jgi:hypothetical protein
MPSEAAIAGFFLPSAIFVAYGDGITIVLDEISGVE